MTALPKATFFYVAYTKDDVPDISKRPMAFVYNGGPGSASLFTHMGLGPKRIVLTDDGHGMPAPYSIVDNGRFVSGRHRPGVRGCRIHRLQPPRAGRKSGAVLRRGPRRHLVLRFHLPIHHAQRALGLAEVPDRRKLRHHALGRAGVRSPAAPPDLPERHCAHLFGGFRQLGRRRPVQVLPAHLRHIGLVSPPAAARPAEGERRSGGAGGAPVRPRRLCRRAGKGRPVVPGRVSEDGQRPGALHGPFDEVHRGDQPAHQPLPLVQGTRARQAPHGGPPGFAFRRHGRGRRRRDATNTTRARPPTKARMPPCFRITCAAS